MNLKPLLTAILAFTALAASAEKVQVSTPGNTLVLELVKGQEPRFVYYGARLSDDDVASLQPMSSTNWSRSEIYPAYGATHMQQECCLAMRHADGNLSTDMRLSGWTLAPYSDHAPNGASRQGTLLTISLHDPVYPTTVTLNYLAYSDVDMIESWTDITNGEKKTVTLTRFMNPLLPVRRGNVHCTHFHGSWAAEAQMVESRLCEGQLVVKDKDGLRNATQNRNEILLSLDGPAREGQGRVIGASLMYSGNYLVTVDTDDTDYHYYMSGINPDNSEYHLRRGETFTTPHTALTFSQCGTNGISQTFHRWARKYQLRHGDKPRDILLNSWEGVYFNITQESMDQMMADIHSMGGELFVMDDGWFGRKYRRDSDNAALGDWTVDERKLPRGIEGLIQDADKNGVKFGIWIEPEMTNTASELYEKHPDWILKAPGREPVRGRGGTQLCLDLANPQVEDFAFGVVDSLLAKYPQISYIKWDCNAPVMNHGSQYLPAADQSHMEIAYHRGLVNLCQRIRAKYPDVVIQDCASGGGRVNYGLLPYFDEFWVSDNTDALQRIYMQWGTSYFYPAIAMAQHISAVPNHCVFRTTSLKYRCDVAMSGRLGMEIQPKNMSEEEKALCRQAISDYKQIRPVVQMGDLYRLHSPYEGDNVASLMYVDRQQRDAVFFWYKLETHHDQHLPRIQMQGLNPQTRYTVHELNRIDNKPLPYEGLTFTGEYLMNNGLEIPLRHDVDYDKQDDWSSRVIRLTAL